MPLPKNRLLIIQFRSIISLIYPISQRLSIENFPQNKNKLIQIEHVIKLFIPHNQSNEMNQISNNSNFGNETCTGFCLQIKFIIGSSKTEKRKKKLTQVNNFY